ncbi:Autophagy-related protein 2 [Erysiphe neolycopersici]|uniref:Autophagy-related protein 2 n=1 Tax=Erysiphe neolycopersici TaxID=212602 RepID=A0A420HTA5_9PEZI|nr:Autophagy-related protein 2 [Erysiphe neolycopersici]
MSSYFQSYFQKTSMSRRLLQYAISRLGIIDTDVLDLENLDIAWGKNSVFEFKNVELRMEKLENIISLPQFLGFSKANITLLRLTIPVDIYSSPIKVEVEGLQTELQVKDDEKSNHKNSDNGREQKFQVKDPDRSHLKRNVNEKGLPNPQNLAQSFLESEPEKEKTELEAAIFSEPYQSGTLFALGYDGETHTGMATSLALPTFISRFLQGITDRLQIKIKNVESILKINIPIRDSKLSSLFETADSVSVRLKIQEIDIKGVGQNLERADKNDEASNIGLDLGSRLIFLSQIRGYLESESALLNTLASSSTTSQSSHVDIDPRDSLGQFFDEIIPLNSDDVEVSINKSTISPLSNSSENQSHPLIPQPTSRNLEIGSNNNYVSKKLKTQSILESENPESSLNTTGHIDQKMSSDDPFTCSPHSKSSSPMDSTSQNLLNSYSENLEILESRSHQLEKTSHQNFQSSIPSSLPNLKNSEIRASQDLKSYIENTCTNEALHRKCFVAENDDSSIIRPIDNIAGNKPHSEDFSILSNSDKSEISQSSINEEGSMYMSAISHEYFLDQTSENTQNTSDKSTRLPMTQRSPLAPIKIEGISALQHGFQKSSYPQIEERIRTVPTFDNHVDYSNVNASICSASPEDSKIRISPIERNITSRCSKKIFNLNNVKICIPGIESASTINETTAKLTKSTNSHDYDRVESSFIDLPGSFSTKLAKPRSYLGTDTEIPKSSGQSTFSHSNDSNGVRINLGIIRIDFDISVGKLILRLASLITDIMRTQSSDSSNHVVNSELVETIFKLYIDEISLNFLDRLEGIVTPTTMASDMLPSSGDVLLKSDLIGLQLLSKISKSSKKTSFSLRQFSFGYKDESILSFDSSYPMKSSVRDLKASDGVDISAHLTQTSDISRFEVSTLPIKISINLQKLDDTFSWFGGLSSVLNLGSTIASSATAMANSPCKSKNHGVRFETSIRTNDTIVLSQNKSDIRIGGCRLDLIGSECSLILKASAVKIVSREEGIGLSVNKVKLSGPHIYLPNNIPAITIEITSIRLEILPSPKDRDFDRLLSLITPSKSKYDHDDDILLDTLLRQRDKGAVLRLTVDDITAHITKIDEMIYFPELLEEVSKLATVAKYLPEDDSSGLLSLVLVRRFELVAESGHAFGNLKLLLTDLEIAQITFPILLAISMESLSLSRNNTEMLIESTTIQGLQGSGTKVPVIMARMIGNEMEPMIKIMLWNLNFEYHLPTFMSLLEFLENIKPLDISTKHCTPVANSVGFVRGQKSKAYSPKNLTDKSLARPLNIHVVLRDCTLGLNPLRLPSKVLLTLTESHLNLIILKNDDANVSVELKKVSILVIDDIKNLASTKSTLKNRQYMDGRSSKVTHLCSIGYVSIGYLSSAKVNIHMKTVKEQREIDVEACDDLLVLESCADSTQTLVAVLSGLLPANKYPGKETKYRTKVVPVDDLLASLSADAFGTAEGDYNFDDDFGVIDDVETNSLIDFEENDDFDSRYYGENDEIENDEKNSSNLIARETQDGVLLDNISEPDDSGDDTELEFQENHFGASSSLEGDTNKWNSTKNTYERSSTSKIYRTPINIRVRDFHITWNLFDGYDWQSTRDTITKAVQEVTSKTIERQALSQDFDDEDESVIEDFLFNSIYIGVPANRDPCELTSAINQDLNDNDTDSTATTTISSQYTRSSSSKKKATKQLQLHRSKHHKITFDLRGVCVDFIAFPPGTGETQSSLNIRIQDFEIFDHIQTSTWKKFATYMQDAGQRQTDSNMIQVKMLNVKPVEESAASEIVLKATFLPLRLHIDQDALDFITRFFEFKDNSISVQTSRVEEPFIQRVEVDSIKVKLDFKPKRVDYAGLRSGHTTEFMNFLILDGADIELRHTIIYGISGFEKLGKCLNDIWMPDVKRNQLPGILAGLAPVRPLVNVGSGFRHLVIVPIREYKKDGRIIRSISKGAAVFAKTTGTEIVKLGAKMAVGVQTILQGAEGFLSPSDNLKSIEESSSANSESKKLSLYANQPFGVLQGFRGGYNGLQRDLVLARDAIIAVSGEAMDSGTAVGAFKAMGRHAPTVILRPAIGVVKAGGQILMGATNSLDPVNLQRAEAKYKK